MIAKNIKFINQKTKINLIKQNILLSHNLFVHNRLRYNITHSIQHKLKSLTQKSACFYSNNYKQQNGLIKDPITNKPQYLYSVQQKIQNKNQQQAIDYNNYDTILQLKRLQQKQPSSSLSFHQKRQPAQNLSNKYKIISYQYEQKFQMLQKIIHSNERNLFKIIQEIVIVIQSLVQTNKKQVLEQNLIKVIKQFNNKLISSHLQNLSQLEYYQKDNEIGGLSKQQDQEGLSSKEQNDNTYGLHQKYGGNKDNRISGFDDETQMDKNQVRNISNLKNNLFNIKFICFYIEAIKDVILKKIDNQTLVKQVQQQIYQFLTARQVSDIQDLINKQISNLQKNYINQKDFKKRSLYPFQKKLRLICLIPYFQNKQNIDKYLNRLADQNLMIYLKQSQIISLMYDIVQQQVMITHGEYVYQVQATFIYQAISSINACYIKSQFIDYVRKFMVCYQEIQFYEIFKDLEQKLKNSSIKTFIRALKILKSQAGDLHCQYNKTMNKYNWNIIISIIISQVYTLQNTKLDDLLQMYQSVNSADNSGQVLYEQLTRYLKQYSANSELKYSDIQLDRLYKIFNYALQQIKPVQKYDQKDGLNKQFTKRTYNLITSLLDIVGQKYPQSFLKAHEFLRFYLEKDYSPYFIEHYNNNQISIFPDNGSFKEINKSQIIKLQKIASSLKKYDQYQQKYSILNKQKLGQLSTTEYLNVIRQYYKKRISRKLVKDGREGINTLAGYVNQGDNYNSSNVDNQVNYLNSNKLTETQGQKLLEYSFFYELYNINHPSGQLNPKLVAQIDNKLFKNLILPLLKQYQNLMLNAFYNLKAELKLSVSQKIHIYQNLLILLKILNSMSFSTQHQTKSFVQQIHYYSKTIHTSIFTQMKHKIVERQLLQQKQLKENRKFLNLSTLSYHNTMLICLEYISQLNKKIFDFENVTKEQNLSSSTTQYRQKFLQQNLPLIYKFMNNIAISDFKNINKNHIVNMLSLMRKIQFVRSSITPVLLVQFNIKLYEYLYQSLSMFMIYMSERGKFYMSLVLIRDPQIVDVIRQFVQKKNQFKNCNKRKLVPLQIIMAQLIRKKIIKLKETHLKKNQHSQLFLQFLQIFESPQNIIVDLKTQLKSIEFTNNVLQDFSNDFLEEFSQCNGSISRYLEDNKIGLSSIKKLNKMDAEELKKQFQSGRASKIYELILKNLKFNLPFQLPKPQQKQSQNTKTLYILETIYQKIKRQQKYELQIKQKSSKGKKQQASQSNKNSIIDEYQLFTQKEQSNQQKKSRNKNKNNSAQLSIQQTQEGLLNNGNKQKDTQKSGGKGKKSKGKRQPKQTKNPSQKQQTVSALTIPLKGKQSFINQTGQDTLKEQKQYIIKEGLVQHKYEDHYKLNQNQLQTNYKKQTWKTFQFLFKQQEVQSYQIDQKMNQNIYKDILKSLLGYVEKVKKVTKEFHAHSYIQYIGMSLQLDVIYHGCVVRVSRKNRPQDNILFVCASQTNYKLMYICTYILKQSGQNVYILGQNTKQHDFRQFLQKNLPQSFESQQPEIVQKVLKRGIVLPEQQIQLSKQQ